MVANENLCVGPLNGSLFLKPSISGREQPYCFSPPVVICVLFRLWAGDPSLVFRTHTSQGDLISCLIIPPVLPPVGARPAFSSLPRTPYQSVVLKLILLAGQGYKCSLSLVFSCLFQWFLHNLVVIPDWSWEEVSVASTHSSTILCPTTSMVDFKDCSLNRTFQSSWLGAIGTQQWKFHIWKIMFVVCNLFSDL